MHQGFEEEHGLKIQLVRETDRYTDHDGVEFPAEVPHLYFAKLLNGTPGAPQPGRQWVGRDAWLDLPRAKSVQPHILIIDVMLSNFGPW